MLSRSRSIFFRKLKNFYHFQSAIMANECETVGNWMEKQGILLGGIQGLTPKEALNAFKNDKMASNPNIIRVVETKNSDGTSIWFCH